MILNYKFTSSKIDKKWSKLIKIKKVQTEVNVSMDIGAIQLAVNVMGFSDLLIMWTRLVLELFVNKVQSVLYVAYPTALL